MNPAVAAIERVRLEQRTKEQKTGERVLFNPSPEARSFIHDATTYVIPPSGLGVLPDEERPREHDGTLRVWDIYRGDPKFDRENRKRVKAGRQPVYRPKSLVIPSLNIADHAVRKLGKIGIVMLTGDPAIDVPLRKHARDAYIAWRKEDCEKIVERYRTRTRDFFSDPRNAQRAAPKMSKAETDAEIWLNEFEAGIFSEDAPCPFNCGFRHSDEAVMQRHLKSRHPLGIEQDLPAAAAVGPEPRVEPKKGRRGRKVATTEAATA